MELVKDSHNFHKAISAYFDIDTTGFRSVCSCDATGTPLGGCAFSPVKDGITYAYILALNHKWASVELYKEIMRLPFITMGANKVVGLVSSSDSRNIGLRMGGVPSKDGSELTFDKATVLARAEEMAV